MRFARFNVVVSTLLWAGSAIGALGSWAQAVSAVLLLVAAVTASVAMEERDAVEGLLRPVDAGAANDRAIEAA